MVAAVIAKERASSLSWLGICDLVECRDGVDRGPGWYEEVRKLLQT